uniref:Radial spoke head 4 homolog A n=1 Tax=Nothobranchius kuhntae TaxID=321403 RepID=A0A1A8IXR5_NOTKU
MSDVIFALPRLGNPQKVKFFGPEQIVEDVRLVGDGARVNQHHFRRGIWRAKLRSDSRLRPRWFFVSHAFSGRPTGNRGPRPGLTPGSRGGGKAGPVSEFWRLIIADLIDNMPKEAAGTGANKFVYYVCNKPGQAWVRLPSVSPAQIAVARQINRFFTGRLDSVVLSYPPFPGNEANYLRAQIARISAGTQISPFDFYQLIKKESDEEDEALLNNYEINADFEGISASEMVKDMANWVHHAYHILPQGRCTWVNLAANLDTEEEDEEANEPEPEVGPPILTAVSHDAEMFDCPPWSSWLSSTLTPQHALAVLCSVLWPGAYACAHAKEFVNIYIGRGLKCVGEEYSPPLPPPPQEEYPIGSEVTEKLDPQVEEEQALSLEGQQEASEGTVESEEGDEDEDDD